MRSSAGGGGLADRFAHELSEVGGKPIRVATVGDAVKYVLDLVTSKQAKLVALSKVELAEKNLEPALKKAGVRYLHASKRPPVAELAKADIGVTGADIAIAESGTIGLVTSLEHDRLVSALPFVHVALLRGEHIVPSLADALMRLGPALATSDNSVLSLITGPSRTADIELQLVRGVHGPNEVHVVIID